MKTAKKGDWKQELTSHQCLDGKFCSQSQWKATCMDKHPVAPLVLSKFHPDRDLRRTKERTKKQTENETNYVVL